MQRFYANRLIYGSKIQIYNTKNKLQATDFTPAERNLARDSGSKVTAKCYCPDLGRIHVTTIAASLTCELLLIIISLNSNLLTI